MINIINLSKSYGKKVLFSNLSLNINPGEKIGLIGPNGAGKSSLFSLLLGDTEPSSGSVQVNKGVRIGYLPQESSFHSQRTVIDELTAGDRTIIELKKEKEELENRNAADSNRYGEILHILDHSGYFELEHKAEKILMGLGFKESDFNKPVSQLSGGWQMRTLLAKLLTFRYDILLLDEPTNYLDLNAALWLKDYLSDFDGTFIMISHDKDFLNDVTNYTLILENGSIYKVKGNYEHYEQIKEEKRTHLMRQFKEQEKKKEQLERFVTRFHAQPNKAAAVRAKRTALEKMEDIVVPLDPRESIGHFSFPPTKASGYKVMNLQKISKAYGDTVVYKDFDFEILQGEKAVLVGENGAGKSTLLKIMAGVVDIDSGSRVVGHNVDLGYFSQTRMDVLNPENTVLREAYSAAPGYMAESAVRSILGAFLFSGEDAEKPVKVLSGGEKSRLILAKLLINPPNFLLLDEPTTHLDVDAVDALIKAMNEYEGTVVFISHDVHFVRSLANVVYEVKSGSVRKFFGNFDYYMDKKANSPEFIPEKKKKVSENRNKQEEEKLKAKEEEKLRREEERRRKNHNIKIRAEINKLEKRKEELELESYAKCRALSNPHIFRDEETARDYGRRLKEIEKEAEELNIRIKKFEEQIK
ncbi:MAG: ABC-F family ATP-binding cassette domain-containing protein [Candidatus Omnitrophica bacterium]|jgi:ATP-binding cassette subfamily F protein 3|nr:ATP-binding cassette domain-containing protein [Candidatus Omnitrophota bacterium]MDD5080337.1 ABC-F family ATP-binding cassette domain-containing protein [Candidatus Omnitrophota bacterium]